MSSISSMPKMYVSNIVPDYFASIQLSIPANQPDYTQHFNASLNLSNPAIKYCITYSSIIIYTSGFYNVRELQTVVITGGTHAGTITLQPGYYDITTLTGLLFVTIPLTGPNSFKTTNISGGTIDFTNATTIRKILGFEQNNIVGNNQVSNDTVDFTLGYDTAYFSCDLVELATPISPVYFNIVAVNPGTVGQVIYGSNSAIIPVQKKNISSIRWKIYNRDGELYNINTPITIHIDISGWRVHE